MLAELILDFIPWPSRPTNHGTDVLGRMMPDRLHIPETDTSGAIKRALNDSGWVDGEVIAAGDVQQGKEPSVVAMLTGHAVIELLRPRRSKALPRHFVLAVTSDRVVAFTTLSTGGDGAGDVYELWVRPDEIGSWTRESVRLTDMASRAGTLELSGAERFPVYRQRHDPSTEELFALLAG